MAALKRATLALLAALGGGCGSFVHLDSARTVPPGRRETLVGFSAYAGRPDGNVFNVDVAVRRGLGPRSDLGFRFNFLGVSSDLKLQLVRSADPGRGMDVAVAPSLGVFTDIAWKDDWIPQAGVPLLVGINVGQGQFVVAPQLVYRLVPALPGGIIEAGGTVSFAKLRGPGFGMGVAVAVWKSLEARRPIGSLRGPGEWVVQPALVMRWGP